jgi:uncharacterized glyoxalase superfamily protein PhnB
MGEARSTFNQVNIIVRDMSAVVDFYTRLGVVLRDAPADWLQHHRAAVSSGDITLEFDSVHFAEDFNRGSRGRDPDVIVGFAFESRQEVDVTYADLVAAGYRGQQEPYGAFWGSRYAIVEDPDGHAVGLMSPVDDQWKTRPIPRLVFD